ncbi:MAG TPA: ester cyclase [Dehalococcoidia bacterium]|nr:ester cyclase [Dehalococcoidia bacterium]
MSIEENKEVVRRYIEEILNNLDYSNADELADKDFFGMGGTITSIEEHKQYFTDQREKIPDIRNNLIEMIAEGDKVVAISMVSGTDVGGAFNHPPTDKYFDCKVIAVYTFRDGKIAKGEILTDAITAYQQLGFYPPLPEE